MQKINIEDFEVTIIRNIFSKIEELQKHGQFSLNKLLNIIDEEEKTFISKLIMTSEIDEELIMQNMNDCLKSLAIKSIDKKIKKIAKSGDEKTLQELIRMKKIL